MNPLGYYPVIGDVILDPMCPACVSQHADGACPPSCCAPWSLANAEPIFHDSESDTPTHCAACGEVIRHRLTLDGRNYVADAVTFGGGDPDVLRAWLDAYAVAIWGTYAGECSRCLDAEAVAAFVDIDALHGLAAWQVCAECADGDALAPLAVSCRECELFGRTHEPYCVAVPPLAFRHEHDGTPTSEPCTGSTTCADCLDVAEQERRDGIECCADCGGDYLDDAECPSVRGYCLDCCACPEHSEPVRSWVCELCAAEYPAGAVHACGVRIACDECGAEAGEPCRAYCTGADAAAARILQAVADVQAAAAMIRTGSGDPLALLDAVADTLDGLARPVCTVCAFVLPDHSETCAAVIA